MPALELAGDRLVGFTDEEGSFNTRSTLHRHSPRRASLCRYQGAHPWCQDTTGTNPRVRGPPAHLAHPLHLPRCPRPTAAPLLPLPAVPLAPAATAAAPPAPLRRAPSPQDRAPAQAPHSTTQARGDRDAAPAPSPLQRLPLQLMLAHPRVPPQNLHQVLQPRQQPLRLPPPGCPTLQPYYQQHQWWRRQPPWVPGMPGDATAR